MTEINPEFLTLAAGFGGGLALGWIGLRANVCVMGGITDILLMGDWRRFRTWLLAIAVAILGTEGLRVAGIVTLDGAPYLSPGFGWLAAALGGLLFGFGMTLAGGCAQRSLVRLGAGSPKALVVIAMIALFSYLTAEGALAPLRQALTGSTPIAAASSDQSVASLLATAFDLDRATLRTAIAALLGGTLLWLCFKSAAFRQSRRDVGAGIAFGLAVCFGWLVTGGLLAGADGPPDSFNFMLPFADAARGFMGFGMTAIVGVVAGSFLAVAWPWRLRVEWFADRVDVVHHVAGGALMGVGGTLALGCTIGQGVTGVSTLALGSFIAWAAIIGGAVLGVRYLEVRESG